MLAGCTVTIANRQTTNLKSECLRADVIFSATGVQNLITADMVHQNSVIIDIGIVRVAGENGKTKIVGDVDFENVKNIAKAISPVPGGVGPMTITYLLQNTIECCLQQISFH
jgi:methylenetetrahydrofolate dehydrogenase (NADP+)/methenyltetrahydrofolate cyclohydrolase